MRRGSTPTNTFITDVDLSGAKVFVSYEQDKTVIVEKSGEELTIEPTSITLTLTQEETLKFRPGEVLIQVRYVFPDGAADASNIVKTTFERIIKDGVIEP